MSKITNYLKETKVEFKHIVWPTRNKAVFYTLVVIFASVLVAYFLGVFDFVFLRGLEKFISL